MNAKNDAVNICFALEKKGIKACVVSISRLCELREDIETLHAQGKFDADFYREALSRFSFTPPDDLPGASSIIVAAIPRPQNKLTFTLNGKVVEILLPPNQVGFKDTILEMGKTINALLVHMGRRAILARLPLKLLAVRGGLAEYGRNNIAYVPGMGSFFELAAFYSNLDCPGDTWSESRVMSRCAKCRSCISSCPTGAIKAEHFMIRQEKCLTFHNERSAEYPFPEWISASAHNCLIGCMSCQNSCPENKPFLGWFGDSGAFTEEETRLLLKETPATDLHPETIAKLERLSLLEDLSIVPRNLRVFL